jgi:hypothetical protein
MTHRLGALAGMTLLIGALTAAPAVATGNPDRPPVPCAPAPQARATTTPDADNTAGQAANDARVAAIRAMHPDRQLSPYSNEHETGEGWRYAWKGGRMRYVSFLNRQGAMLTGTAFAPDPGRCPGQRPAVLLTEGITANDVLYWWQAQSLAEAGYVVLTFDYMNQGLSEALGHTAEGAPVPPVCSADASCARGSDPATGFLQDAQDALDFLLSTPAQRYPHTGPVLSSDAPFDSSFPYADQVDSRYVGLTGHSEGARVASVLQGLDKRVGALVALDNLASHLKGDRGSSDSQCVDGGIGTDTMPVVPRVPAMGQAAPNNTACNDPELKKFAYEKWRSASIPAVQVVVTAAKHGDWAPNPTLAAGNASVPELAAYWTVAWFDRWLLKDPLAEVRFFTRSFVVYDHYGGPLVLKAQDVFDPSFMSSAATGTNNCLDLRTGCPVVTPALGHSPADASSPADDNGDDASAPQLQPQALPVIAPPAAEQRPAAIPAPAPAPVAAAPRPPFAPKTAAVATSGADGIVALPATGVLLGLVVLLGFRRNERLARRLGTISEA